MNPSTPNRTVSEIEAALDVEGEDADGPRQFVDQVEQQQEDGHAFASGSECLSQGHRLVADAGEEVVGKGDPAVAFGLAALPGGLFVENGCSETCGVVVLEPRSRMTSPITALSSVTCVSPNLVTRLLPPGMASGKITRGFTVRSMKARPWVWLLLVFALLATACGGRSTSRPMTATRPKRLTTRRRQRNGSRRTGPETEEDPAPRNRRRSQHRRPPRWHLRRIPGWLRPRRSSLHPTRRLLCLPRCRSRCTGNRRRHRGRLDLDRAHPVETDASTSASASRSVT